MQYLLLRVESVCKFSSTDDKQNHKSKCKHTLHFWKLSEW